MGYKSFSPGNTDLMAASAIGRFDRTLKHFADSSQIRHFHLATKGPIGRSFLVKAHTINLVTNLCVEGRFFERLVCARARGVGAELSGVRNCKLADGRGKANYLDCESAEQFMEFGNGSAHVSSDHKVIANSLEWFRPSRFPAARLVGLDRIPSVRRVPRRTSCTAHRLRGLF